MTRSSSSAATAAARASRSSGSEQHPKADFPTARVYGRTPGPTLRLITCSGTFDRATGHYLDNTVVFARPLRGL